MGRLIESMGACRFIMLKNTHFDFVSGFSNMFYSFWVFLFNFIGSFFRLPINPFLEDFNERQSNDHVVDQGSSSAMAASTSKYEFLCGRSISGFIEEPATKSFTVHEIYMDSNDTVCFNGGILDSSDSVGAADYGRIEVEMETGECALRFSFGKSFDFDKNIEAIRQEQPVLDYVGNSLVERAVEQPEQDIKDVVRKKTEESVENSIAEIETEDEFEETEEESVEKQAGDLGIEGNQHVSDKTGDFFESSVIDKFLEKQGHENHDCNEAEINGFDDEFEELEHRSEKQSVVREMQSEKDLRIERESMVSPDKTKGQNMQEDEDSEHDDDLIERLKMEVKIARTGGLPTILEDSEPPKMMLGPLQIDEKYDHKDHIVEIQKVYKSYSDKMRKLDILNSQAMHAISLLQLKDVPIQRSTPAIKSLHKALPFTQRKAKADPTKKLLRDLHKDFETLYVGQICLSWAILHWQFRQVKKLSDCDTLCVHQYNQVAGEFQHFQVLLQRFLEDEPFRTRSRVGNYVNYRCSVRHLLQVPVIKDDCSKYKEDAVPSEMLRDIIEESMHVFWDFLRADKDEPNSTSKAPFQSQVAPHDPIDFNLLMDVRADLQKKEKRLKEIQRGTNCILKKFQRQQHQGNLLDHALFIAHVELKLVSRVLNMSKINADQLVWCLEKLQRINFSRRKIEIEPSFTLFPC